MKYIMEDNFPDNEKRKETFSITKIYRDLPVICLFEALKGGIAYLPKEEN